MDRFYLKSECCAIYILRLTDGSLMGRSRTPRRIMSRCVRRSGVKEGGRVVGPAAVYWFAGPEATYRVFHETRVFLEERAGIKMRGDSRTPVYGSKAQLVAQTVRLMARQRGFNILSEKEVLTERGYKQAVMDKRIEAGMFDEEGPKVYLGGNVAGENGRSKTPGVSGKGRFWQ